MDTNRSRSRSPSGRNSTSAASSQHTSFVNPVNALGLDATLAPGSVDQNFQHPNANFLQSQHFAQQADTSLAQNINPASHLQYSHQVAPDEFSSFSTSNAASPEQGFDPSTFLDPSVLESQGIQQSTENSDFYVNMAAMSQASPEAPHHLSSHSSPSHHANPYNAPQQMRHASLDPSSAAMSQGADWTGAAFRNHRRSPSDQYSDVSSQGHPSPFLRNQEQFDSFNSHSPLLNGQQDPVLLPDSLGLGGFSLSDPQQQVQSFTPSHSPHISPNLSPQQQPLPHFNPNDTLGVLPSPANSSHYQSPPQPSEGFPSMQQTGSNPDIGQADQMSPPEINIQLAPPSKQNSFNNEFQQNSNDPETLYPPARGSTRNRSRSDPHSSSSSRSPSPMQRPRSPSQPSAGLHPDQSSRHSSRSPSPTGAGISKGHNRRSSMSSVPHHREQMLTLADPSRHASPGVAGNNIGPGGTSTGSEGNKRAQKHPATFQCHLCPKRFTRAYNLRSHLRTHTDERPFVCTVCGKAFARQHDRKRHESLHSGEKKFVCRGLLANGANGTWGCGRRFARADALGRHFRSEAGRACIKPLLDEEARERQAALMDQANQQMMNAQQGGMIQAPPPQIPMDFNTGNNFLPAALLQQFPALAEIQWDNLPPAGMAGEDGEYEGRSSFEASDFEFEDGDGSGYVSGPGMGSDSYVAGGGWGHNAANNGWASDIGDR